MNENENGVTESGSPAEGSEHQSPESTPQGGAETKENHIPHSRAEEMWTKREQKLRETLGAEWRTKEDGYKKQMEDLNGKLVNGQLAFLKSMGWYKDEPEKPLTRAELQEMMKTEREQTQRALLAQVYEDRIRAGWDQVTTKFPELANNKMFQEASLGRYAQNPNIPLAAHAESIVKELLDPYHTKRAAALQEEREARKTPDRRVVPGGRGAGGGTGSNKDEKKMTMAERIRSRLAASKE